MIKRIILWDDRNERKRRRDDRKERFSERRGKSILNTSRARTREGERERERRTRGRCQAQEKGERESAWYCIAPL
jgi:hypothetical protein